MNDSIKYFVNIFLITIFLTGCGGGNNENNSTAVITKPITNDTKTVVSFGSSTLEYMKDDLTRDLNQLDYTYVSDSIGGQIVETMQAHQGSNKIYINFENNTTLNLNQVYPIKWNQEINFGNRKVFGEFDVAIENAQGKINLDKNTFLVKEIKNNSILKNTNYELDFNYSKYIKNSIFIINVGKNNLSSGYSSKQIFNSIKLMTDYLDQNSNQKYIIIGYFVDTNGFYNDEISKTNELLRNQYQNKYFDLQDYLSSTYVWSDTNIQPTNQDLINQNKRILPVSLSRNSGHLNEVTGKIISLKISKKIIELYS